MMNGIIAPTLTILTICFSTVTLSAVPPDVPGTIYDNGPLSPLLAKIDLSRAEMAAYALYEGVMQVAEAKIHATSCDSSIGTYTVDIFTDGSKNNRPFNFVDVTSNGGAFTLDADLHSPVLFRGQKVSINQSPLIGEFDSQSVMGYSSIATYYKLNNLMTLDGKLWVAGANGFLNYYTVNVIKGLNRGSLDSGDPDHYKIVEWGLGSLHMLGHPVNKYWDRLKSRRGDSIPARTVFVKDRLVGATSCRITIDTMGENNEDIFWQEGTLIIEQVDPSAPVLAFSEF